MTFKQRSLIDAARSKPPKPAPASPQPPVTPRPAADTKRPIDPTARPQKQKPPVVGTESVTVLCGHTLDFELFPEKQDKYRDQRRAKLAEKACPACRHAANNERQKLEAEARAAQGGQGPKKPKTRRDREYPGRLPHGAHFEHVVYDAEKMEWAGVLHVPDPAGEQVFQGRGSSLFGLHRYLGQSYRTWRDAQDGTAVATTTEGSP